MQLHRVPALGLWGQKIGEQDFFEMSATVYLWTLSSVPKGLAFQFQYCISF